MEKIIGHHKQKNLLGKFISGKKLHHGFIFSGPAHIGKMTIARVFAQALTTGQTEIVWQSTEHVADGDIAIVAPVREEKKGKDVYKDISIDQILAAQRSFMLVPDKKAKVLIIDEADRMTRTAQNALLKTLEEPQGRRYIILVAHRLNRLLDTMLSRCFIISFSLVGAEEINALAQNNDLAIDAQGRPGNVYRLKEDEAFRETAKYAHDRLRTISRLSLGDRMRLAGELAKKDEKYVENFLGVWIYRIRLAAMQTKKFHLLKVADRIDATLLQLQDTNVNKQLALEDLLIHIA